MSGNNEWFWTPGNLEALRSVLDGAAQMDADGSYIGPVALMRYVAEHGPRHGLEVSVPQAGEGLKALAFLGILEPGRRGVHLPGYKRRYYPQKPAVTADDVRNYLRYKKLRALGRA